MESGNAAIFQVKHPATVGTVNGVQPSVEHESTIRRLTISERQGQPRSDVTWRIVARR